MAARGFRPVGELILRIATFRAPEDSPPLHEELRRVGDSAPVISRWVGRRLLEDARTTEITVVTIWDGRGDVDNELAQVYGRFSQAISAATRTVETEMYSCRAFGSWERPAGPSLIRLFRGRVVEGDPAAFDSKAAELYLSKFESNPSCCSIAAAVRQPRDVVLATLWTDWDAIVGATGGDIGQVLPIQLPGWGVAGAAVHYELIVVEDRQPA